MRGMRLSGGPKCPTSVMVLGRPEARIVFFPQNMAPSSFAHPTFMHQNIGLVQNVDFEAASPKVPIQQVWSGARFWLFFFF